MKPLPRSLQRRSKQQGKRKPGSFGLLDDILPKVLFVTSEFTDFVKTGGLGDVSAALPRALRQTTDVRVLLPGYQQVTRGRQFTIVARIPAAAGLPGCEIGKCELSDGLIVYALLCPELYDREGSPYGDSQGIDWFDNDIRFARLALAAAEIAAGTVAGFDWRPDLLHANDWTAALAPAYLAWNNRPVPSILTIHNLAYQGLFGPERMPDLAFPDHAFQIDGAEFHGRISFLKAGIYYASHVTTVSSTYAREITTPELGCGLDGLLRVRADQGRLSGVLNGIDESWEPRTDPSLAHPFDEHDLSGRQRNTAEARDLFQLRVSRGPLFAIISRLVHQKGIDLVIEAADRLVEQGGQIAVIGQGDGKFESALYELSQRHPGDVAVRVGFDEGEARQLYAGSDFLLMPSRFEPCGLSQMYAQRYGSLPVAHQTGGLADTIEDGVNGLLFREPSPEGLMEGVARALDVYDSMPRLNRMRRAAMRRPADWRHSARAYGRLYQHHFGNLGSRAADEA
ncbi:glycogen synthase GlgA [Mesorhizobium sp. B2-1-3A]|uniref:glycogen synthase GlgA n=1 Tax=Mesorhizobium sp. B2-1-3A TaxID=2589971 RepID=UPI00112DC4CF|nr:glycogen synthase GlgA [Mesorhizobium sp. B2-1-3A]TPM90154.1 glycogen synthase GlgA [Mesorhizobium sp. B2-1-3A]